jgi:hypothetical protein
LEALARPVDQQFVQPDGRATTFSAFAYEYLSFDIVLDGWLTNAPQMTESEEACLKGLPRLRSMMIACKSQALIDANYRILPCVDQVLELIQLWEECIHERIALRPNKD